MLPVHGTKSLPRVVRHDCICSCCSFFTLPAQLACSAMHAAHCIAKPWPGLCVQCVHLKVSMSLWPQSLLLLLVGANLACRFTHHRCSAGNDVKLQQCLTSASFPPHVRKSSRASRLAPSAVIHPTLHPCKTKQQAILHGSCMGIRQQAKCMPVMQLQQSARRLQQCWKRKK